MSQGGDPDVNHYSKVPMENNAVEPVECAVDDPTLNTSDAAFGLIGKEFVAALGYAHASLLESVATLAEPLLAVDETVDRSDSDPAAASGVLGPDSHDA